MVIRAAAFVLTLWATVGFSFCHAQAVIFFTHVDIMLKLCTFEVFTFEVFIRL